MLIRTLYTILILILILFTGCSHPDEPDIPLQRNAIDEFAVYSTEEEPTYRVHFVHEQSFGDTEHLHSRQIGGALADESNRVILFGNVNGSPGIHAFNPDGSHISAIGRTGSGPGEYHSAFYYPFRGAVFDRDVFYETNPMLRGRPDLQAIVENEVRFPETWPVLESILVDDEDRIWTAARTDAPELFHWRVLNNKGELLAEFMKRRNQQVLHVKNGYLYMRETEEESGLQSVEKYRIELN
ncbi:MAG: hypothetical protein WD355_12140 [Balneolaceae bacterium]